MNKTFFLLILLFTAAQQGYAQTSMMSGEGVAVFYPADFDSSRTLPSFAVMADLPNTGALESNWEITPEFTQTDGRTTVRIPFPEGTDLYGNGEVTGKLRRNNSDITLWNTDNYGYEKAEGKSLYQAHPWVLGVRADGSAFGIIADNSWRQEYYLTNPIEIISDGPSFRVVVIEKENAMEVLKTLGDLTGKMQLPPLWALGYQQCRYSYYPDTRVKEIADEFRKRQIPCDVIWMDIDYMEGFRVFTFDDEYFPDPAGLNDYLHDKNFKSVFMIDPGVKKDTSYWVYQQGSAGDHWVQNAEGGEYNGEVWPGQCAFPDYTRPETQKWWATLYDSIMPLGIDGIWNDMNEPAVFDGPGGTMPDSNIHRGGGELPQDIHLRYHNVYGLLMVRASREGILKNNPDKRPFVLSRANYLGGHQYAATWTGDNNSTMENLKMSIPMSLTLGLSGQPFNGPDIGGFVGDANPELLAQWMALGAYYPFCRNHAAKDTKDQEPWAYGENTENVSRTAINRRYRLLPYFYTLFREASETGLPVMRPTFFADFADTTLRAEEQSFLLGQDLLIIPSWAEDVKSPRGDWKKVKLEEEEDGYQATVKLRDGAIVPMGPVFQNTEEFHTDSITLLVNPDDSGIASGRMYHDAGNGFEYKDGGFELLEFSSSLGDDGSLKIEISKTEGDLQSDRMYRIAYVGDNTLTYSDWSANTTLSMAIPKD